MIDEFMVFLRISQGSILLPFVLGLIRIRRLNLDQRLLWFLVSYSLVTEIIAIYVSNHVKPPNNLPFYNLYAVVMFIFLNRIYNGNLDSNFWKRGMGILLVAYVAFAAVNALFIQPFDSINSNTMVFGSVIYIIWSIAYFHQVLKKANIISVGGGPLFWINTGVLLNSSGLLLLYIFMTYIMAGAEDLMIATWRLNAILNIILNCFFAIALWVRCRE